MDFDRLRNLLFYSKGANEEDEDDIDGPGANARKIFFNAIQVESFMFQAYYCRSAPEVRNHHMLTRWYLYILHGNYFAYSCNFFFYLSFFLSHLKHFPRF